MATVKINGLAGLVLAFLVLTATMLPTALGATLSIENNYPPNFPVRMRCRDNLGNDSGTLVLFTGQGWSRDIDEAAQGTAPVVCTFNVDSRCCGFTAWANQAQNPSRCGVGGLPTYTDCDWHATFTGFDLFTDTNVHTWTPCGFAPPL